MNGFTRPSLRVTMSVFLVAALMLAACGEEEPAPPEPVKRVVMERDGETALYPATRFGEGYVSAIAWSPDDRWFVVVGAFGARLYDATDFDRPPVLLPFDNVEEGGAVAFSPDSQWLAVADAKGTVRTWGTVMADTRHVFQVAETANPSAEIDPLTRRFALLAISEDSRWLALYSLGTITLWDLTQGADQQPEIFASPEETVLNITFDHAGRLLVAGSADNDRRLRISTITGEPPPPLDDSPVDYTIRVWDILSGDLVGALTAAPGRAIRVEFLRDGEEALTYFSGLPKSEETYSGSLVIWWNITRGDVLGQVPIKFPTGQSAFAANPDAPLTVALDATVRGYRVEVQPSENANKRVITLDFDEEQGQSLSQTELAIMHVGTKETLVKLMTPLEDEELMFSRVLFNNSRTTLATLDYYGRILFWLLGTPVERLAGQDSVVLDTPNATLDRYTLPFGNLAFSKDGQKIAVVAATPPRAVRVWDRATGQYVLYATLDTFLDATSGAFWLDSMAFTGYSPDGERIAEMEGENTATIKRRTTGEILISFPIPFHAMRSAFTADGGMIAFGGSNGMIGVWDCSSGRQLAVWQGHTSTIVQLAFTPDGKRLISHGSTWNTSGASLAAAEALAGEESQLIVGIAGSGRLQAGWQYQTGDTQAGGIDRPVMDNSIRVWDASTGQLLSILEPRADELFGAMALHPAGDLLAVVVDGPEPVIRLWSMAEEQVVETLHRRDLGQPSLGDLSFSPDGTLLAATDWSGIVWVWELPENDPSE